MIVDRRTALAGLASVPLIGATGASAPPNSKVTIFEAKSIVSMEAGLPPARFVACADGIVLGTAQTAEALAPWSQGRAVTIDQQFADNILFPGLIDPHIHPMQSAVMVNLPFIAPDAWNLPSGTWDSIQTQDEYRARLKRLVQEDQTDPLITWGHHELFHGPLDKAVLDEIAPDRPLFVWQRSFHEIIANTAALASIGLETQDAFDSALAQAKADPAHSNFDKGIFSETGLLVAIGLLRPVLLSPQRMRKGFDDLKTMMRNRGVTTTSDMATGIFAGFDIEAQMIAGHFSAPGTMARLMLMPIATELDAADDLDAWLAKAQRFTGPNVRLDRRVKLFADGAFFAQNMRMGPPGYTDGHQGKWITEPDKLRGEIERFWQAGFSLHIHVNGDEGADVLLDALARLPHRLAQTVTLEHLGYCTLAQIERIGELGLMVSAQPNYIRVLGEAYEKSGLGPDRAELMNRLGALEARNIPLGLHSDFNMAPIDPFYLAWIAETREGIDGKVRGPAERLSRWKALHAITIEAAQVIGMNDLVGSIAPGKKADFTVLDADPFEVETAALKEMKIAATVFEGQVAEALQAP